MNDFKYLGPTVQNNGEYRKEVKKHGQTGWNKRRKVSGMTEELWLKGKVYKTVVRPVMWMV